MPILRHAAWPVFALCVVGAVATPAVGVLIGRHEAAGDTGDLVAVSLLLVALLAFPAVGAVIASRLPRNAVGWLLLGIGLLYAAGPLADAYANAGDPDLPLRAYAGWFVHATIQSPAGFAPFALLLLLVPDGRLPSPRWRPVAWGLVGSATAFIVLVALKPGDLAEVHPATPNPFAVAPIGAVWRRAEVPLLLLLFASIVAAAAGLIARFRRSRGLERQQLKWLATAAGLFVIAILSGPAFFWRVALPNAVWIGVLATGLVAIPLAVGAAILRYRLYDIDRIVSRTLSYSLLMAVLVAVYLVGVLTIGAFLRPLTGEDSSVIVALSTLAVAGAFQPVRRRVQTVVERRFNRRRADGAAVLERFARHLRDEVDLTAISSEILAVAQTSFQPSSVSLLLVGNVPTQS
ncbi:MAG: hypothetical protein M3N57_13235 [Actinomycetota bacterium]|nr:hypothetical protein [Actinomycetota bacterium]